MNVGFLFGWAKEQGIKVPTKSDGSANINELFAMYDEWKKKGGGSAKRDEGEDAPQPQSKGADRQFTFSNVKSWYLQKFYAGLSSNEKYHIGVADDLDGTVVGETEKAVRIQFVSDFGKTSYWFPKSVFYTAEEKQEEERKAQADREARYARYEKLVNFAKEQGLPVRNKMKAATIMQMLKDAGVTYDYYK